MRRSSKVESVVDVGGTVQPGFEPVRQAFQANFDAHGDVGAACCVYRDGAPVVDIWAGVRARGDDTPYTGDTVQVVASATKGAMAICALRLVERGELDLDAPVADYWPEFGKPEIPVRWLLTHQAGLVGVDEVIPMAQVYQWPRMVDALAAQRPYWEPGTAHGYHALTYGWLIGEVTARVTGLTPRELLQREISRPLGIDFQVGMASEQRARFAHLITAPPAPAASPDPLTLRMLDANSLAHKAFFVPNGLFGALNDPGMLDAQLPAANGVGSARALATMYAACLGTLDGVRLLSPETVRAAATAQTSGEDLVTGWQSRFGLGFMLPFEQRPMAGAGSFGHYGLGGSVGFAHPEKGFTFGFTANQMLPGGVPDPRSTALVDALLSCL